jgi:hypothetical protein
MLSTYMSTRVERKYLLDTYWYYWQNNIPPATLKPFLSVIDIAIYTSFSSRVPYGLGLLWISFNRAEVNSSIPKRLYNHLLNPWSFYT